MSELDDDEPVPPFGKRKVKPPVTDEEKRQQALEAFRAEAREVLQEGRERDAIEELDAKAKARKVNMFRFGDFASAGNEDDPDPKRKSNWRDDDTDADDEADGK